MKARVNIVFHTLKDLLNKDQKGFVTPAIFNSLAGVAQLNLYNRLFDDIKDAHRNARANFDPGRDKSLFKRMKEDLSHFVKRESVVVNVDGVFDKPSDLSRIISIRTGEEIGTDGEVTRVQVEMLYDEEKIDRILRSNLSSPSESFPICLISRDIEVFPSTISDIDISYYKVPQSVYAKDGSLTPNSPSVSFFGGSSGIVDPENSYNFELPRHYESELVVEIGAMMGVNLRDQIVMNYATTEQAANNSQQSFS
tara:strand:+ start:223 stop:981 length:759 start_codon:yes stop_codon:yes gene_type:complete